MKPPRRIANPADQFQVFVDSKIALQRFHSAGFRTLLIASIHHVLHNHTTMRALAEAAFKGASRGLQDYQEHLPHREIRNAEDARADLHPTTPTTAMPAGV